MRYELKVGYFLVFGIIILVLSYFVLGSFDLIKSGTSFKLKFNDLTGLSRSSVLELKGVKVGKIRDIYLDKEGTGVVDVWIEGRYKLPRDTRFFIKDLGIMGEKYIMVYPGKDTLFIKKGDIINGELTPSFQDISKKANAIGDTAQVIINRIKDSIDPETISSLRTSMISLQKMVENLNDLVGKNQKRIDNTFVNIQKSSQNIQKLSNQDPEQIAHTLNELNKASRNLSYLSSDLRVTAKQINLLLLKIDSREGTIGKLINDPSLYNNLNNLLIDMKQNPKRYINVRVF